VAASRNPVGNLAADCSVKRYLANAREEHMKARAVLHQAEPFLVGNLVTISYINALGTCNLNTKFQVGPTPCTLL